MRRARVDVWLYHSFALMIILWVLITALRAFGQPVGEIDPLAIHTDGTSTATAVIPFAEGISVVAGKFVKLATSGFDTYPSLDSTSGVLTLVAGRRPGFTSGNQITIKTDSHNADNYQTGQIRVQTGSLQSGADDGVTGPITLSTGAATFGISTGSSGAIEIRTGNANGAGKTVGNIYLRPGNALGGATPGAVIIEGESGEQLDMMISGDTTLNDTLTGLLRGDSGLVSVATAGVDYVAAETDPEFSAWDGDVANLPAVPGEFVSESFNGTDPVVSGSSTITITAPGDIVLGNSSQKVMYPATSTKVDLGKSANKFRHLYLSGDALISGDLTGSRQSHHFFHAAAVASSTYMYVQGTTVSSATAGWPMPYAGSIRSWSCSTNVTTATSGDMDVAVRVNGSAALSVDFTAAAGAGQRVLYATQARGVDTFSAGDVLSIYATETGTMGITATMCIVEVQYDA